MQPVARSTWCFTVVQISSGACVPKSSLQFKSQVDYTIQFSLYGHETLFLTGRRTQFEVM